MCLMLWCNAWGAPCARVSPLWSVRSTPRSLVVPTCTPCSWGLHIMHTVKSIPDGSVSAKLATGLGTRQGKVWLPRPSPVVGKSKFFFHKRIAQHIALISVLIVLVHLRTPIEVSSSNSCRRAPMLEAMSRHACHPKSPTNCLPKSTGSLVLCAHSAGQMWGSGELEKKVACALDCIGKGAAALSEAGNAVYTLSNAMQKQGISGLLQPEPWKAAPIPIPTLASNLAPDPTSTQELPARKSAPRFAPQDDDEKRAILQLRLERAMQAQDGVRVQQLSRELDEVGGLVRDTTRSASGAPRPPTAHVQTNTPPLAERQTAVDDHTLLPPPCTTESTPMDAMALKMPNPFFPHHSSCMHASCPPACYTHASYPPNYQPFCHPHVICPPGCLHVMHPYPMFGYAREFDAPEGHFADQRAAITEGVPTGVSARMLPTMEEPFWRPVHSSSCAMVLATTTPQASVPRSVVSQEAVHALSRAARPLVPSHGTTLARGGSPPRVEEVYDMTKCGERERFLSAEYPSFRLPRSVDMERVPSTVDPAAVPTGRSSAGLASGNLSSAGFSLGRLASDIPPPAPVGTPSRVGASTGLLLLEMRAPAHLRGDDASPIPAPNLAVMPSAVQQPTCNDPYDSDDSVGSPLKGIYEVETILDMRKTAAGQREFLIKWRGWGPSWNNWEPEDNILDRSMLHKFNPKKRPIQAEASQDVDDFTMHSKRRCAKQAAVKARMVARSENEEEGDE